jgi:hypothetical protein
MGIEGADDRRPAFVRGAGDGAPDHGLVAEVETVEIAKGDDRIPEDIRNTVA